MELFPMQKEGDSVVETMEEDIKDEEKVETKMDVDHEEPGNSRKMT